MDNIILIGFMGCGKTTVGVKLSYRLRRTVVDTDKEIEKEEKRAISDIFATDGEEYFRDRETACLRKMLGSMNNQIISVGGGLPLREENRAILRRLGLVFYLRARPETIYERVKHDTTRPLLQGSDPQEKIRTLLAKRDGAYTEAADVIIDVDDKDFGQILCEIEENVNQFRAEGD
ncbi:MAG: shikimate kinase [Lachnospiraceae bacterium]|nr:shikimate kinase [Lachnospiraceae bacterium]